jgi:hypothetical protein
MFGRRKRLCHVNGESIFRSNFTCRCIGSGWTDSNIYVVTFRHLQLYSSLIPSIYTPFPGSYVIVGSVEGNATRRTSCQRPKICFTLCLRLLQIFVTMTRSKVHAQTHTYRVHCTFQASTAVVFSCRQITYMFMYQKSEPKNSFLTRTSVSLYYTHQCQRNVYCKCSNTNEAEPLLFLTKINNRLGCWGE